MRISTFLVFGAALLLGMSALAFAQRGPGGGMWGGRMWQGGGMGPGGGGYDAAAEVTVAGTIEEVWQMRPNGPGGVHLQLRSDAGVVEVRLGPAAYLAEKKFELAAGDAIGVIGSKVQMGGRDVIIARELTKGGQVLELRSASGVPLWSAAGGGAGCPCWRGTVGI